jgi:hypothetical protein
LNHS